MSTARPSGTGNALPRTTTAASDPNRRIRLSIILGVSLLLVAQVLAVSQLVTKARDTATVAATGLAERIGRSVEGAVNRAFVQVDATLLGLPLLLAPLTNAERPDIRGVNAALRQINSQNFAFRDILLIGADGHPIAAALPSSRRRTLPVPLGPDYVEAGLYAGGLAIGGPAINPSTAEFALFFARGLQLPGFGPIHGVAEVGLPSLASLLNAAGEAPGLRIWIERTDGTILASYPQDNSRLGQRIPDATGPGPATIRQSRLDGREVISLVRSTIYPHIRVVTEMELDPVLADWRDDRDRAALFSVALTLVLLALMISLLVWVTQRSKVETERLRWRQRLESALNSMSDGFVMFDADDRLIISNQSYRDMYQLSAPFIEEGARFDDIVREGARRGQYPQLKGDIDSFIRELQQQRRSSGLIVERLLPGGRWILITERAMPDGGTVGIRTDITALKAAMTQLAAARDEAEKATVARGMFLARMSHELRTPLNSILILGQQLAENADTNLSPRQVEFAKTIHAAGTDLLNLISDILDLSKIESGTVTVEVEAVRFDHLRDNLLRAFRHEAERRELDFTIELAPDLGPALDTDPKRLQQILKNLLSNAFKFTPRGSVRVRAFKAAAGWSPENRSLRDAGTVVAIEVSDSGIGISQDKQKIVFEAFQQADAGTSRQYGGTGLGLAISREIAGLLGGELQLQSEPGAGSAFTLYLPLRYADPGQAPVPPRRGERTGATTQPLPAASGQVDDDRHLEPGDAPVLLLVEDDVRFAGVLRDLARAQGFRVLVATTGGEALRLVREHRPAAICLDIFLPDMLGWTVLARLKQDAASRHIPVQILTVEDGRQQSLERGAFAYLAKPSTPEAISGSLQRIRDYALPRVKRLLVVEDDAGERLGIEQLIAHDDVALETVGCGAALDALARRHYDCAVVDLRRPGNGGLELIERIQAQPELQDLPVVGFTGRELGADESRRLRHAAKSVPVRAVESPERLLDETALVLHRVIADLPPTKRRVVERLHASDEIFAGKRVLVVDDDVRNIFAMSSILERHGMQVLAAGTGQEAIGKVAAGSGIAAVLMDIMMPGMDGYETIRAIRRLPASRALPIIAVTAKAMKGDREKCLEAGASDYLAKPVVTEELLGVLRQWLHR